MDSGNSASMQSSSGAGTRGGGGGDEEYDSRSNESISLLFKSAAASTHHITPEGGLFHSQLQPPQPQQQQPPSYHDHYPHSFESQPHSSLSNTINYFDSSVPPQPPPTSSLMTSSLHNYRPSTISGVCLADLDSVWAKTLRPDQNLNGSSSDIDSMMMMLPASTNRRPLLPGDHDQLAVSFGGDATTQAQTHGASGTSSAAAAAAATTRSHYQTSQNNISTNSAGNDCLGNSSTGNNAVARNPKKRSRASRRAPTTVLTTDTTNFRAKVQEFTGIPAPPFTSSPFSRGRFDLFSSGGGTTSSTPSTTNLFLDPSISLHQQQQPPLTNYLLKPFPQKLPSFLPSSTTSNIVISPRNSNTIVAAATGTSSYTSDLPQLPSHLTDHRRDHDDDLGGMTKRDLLINENLPSQQSSFLHQRYPLSSNINPTSSNQSQLQVNESAGLNPPADLMMPPTNTPSDGERRGGEHTSIHSPSWSYGLGLQRLTNGAAVASGQPDTKAINAGCNSNTAGSSEQHLVTNNNGEFVNSKGMLESWISSSTE